MDFYSVVNFPFHIDINQVSNPHSIIKLPSLGDSGPPMVGSDTSTRRQLAASLMILDRAGLHAALQCEDVILGFSL